jgi:hypothetical protein
MAGAGVKMSGMPALALQLIIAFQLFQLSIVVACLKGMRHRLWLLGDGPIRPELFY